MKKRISMPKKLLAVLLSLLMLVPAFSVMTAFAAPGKNTTYTLAQITAQTSLPVINIEVQGGVDVNRDEKVKQNIATFTLDSDHNGEADMTVNYADNKMTIKGRGNSSWTMNTGKKPYNIKFDSKVNLLGMGKNKSWSLIPSWVDSSYIRNYIAYKTGKLLNTSAMDCELVDLCINGQYEGIYLLVEKYGLGDTRVATAGDGYDVDGDGEVFSALLEADSRALTNNELLRMKLTESNSYYVCKDPDEDDLAPTDPQFTQLESEMQAIDYAIMHTDNYENFIDLDSFIDVYIVNELYKNPDFGYGDIDGTHQAAYSSSFCYKEEGGKLYFGTIWDFDIAMGRNNYLNQASEKNRDTMGTTGFICDDNTWCSTLLAKPYVQQKLKERWMQVRDDMYHVYNTLLPNAVTVVSPSVSYDVSTWGAASGRGTDWNYRTALDFAQECDYVESFVGNRLAYLDSQWMLETEIEDTDSYWARANTVTTGSYSNFISNPANYAHKALVEGTAPASVLAIFDETGAVKGMENVFDGGNGLVEIGGTEVTKYGTKSTIEDDTSGPLASPITISGPTGNVYNWIVGDKSSGGFGETVRSITVSNAGRYLYCVNNGNHWFNAGTTYTMGNTYYIYIVDVSSDGGVTVYDGSLAVGANTPATVQSTNYATISGSNGNYTLGFSSGQQGNTGTKIGGSSAPQNISISFNSTALGGDTLYVTNRPSTSAYAGTPAYADAVYINFEGANPASWHIYKHGTTQPATGIATFKESNMLLTAVGPGSVDVTAYTANGTASNTLTINVAAKPEEATITEADKQLGIYAPSVIGCRDEQDHWATIANGNVARFTAYVDLPASQFSYAPSYYLASEDGDQILGGKADYYIYVNGTPYIKAVYGADSNLTNDTFPNTYTIVANNSAYANFNRYAQCETYIADISSNGLRDLLHAGGNRIDIIVKADADTGIIRPYLFANVSDEIIEQEDVTGVTISQSTASIDAGATVNLTATVAPANASNQNVTWSSSNTSVATVNQSGKVTGVAPGTAVITVTTEDGGFTDTCTVTVNAVQVAVSINNGEASVSVSQYATSALSATVTPSGINSAVTWSSSNSSIASVDANGVVTGNAIGTATITATSVYDSTASDTITVNVTPLSYTLSIRSIKDTIGLTEVLTLTPIFSANIPDQSYTWIINGGTGSGYISYDVFHPTSAGTVEVMVRSNYNPRIKATKTITIDGTHHALMGISPVNANVSVEQGGTAQLEVTYNPANASNKTLTWTSVYPEIATVDANGVVTGVSAGTGMIIACSEDGGRACIFAVNVTAPAASIVINNGAASASVTDLGTTNLTVVLSNTTYQAVTWSSSDTTVATVSGNASSATVTALKPGTVTITAEYSYDSAIKDTISVTVNKANVSVSISGNSTVEEESNITLTASVTPAVYDRSVTWSSSNTSVATVSSSGVVTGVGEGTATITATSKYDTTKTATKTITVTAKSQGGGTTIYAPAFSASQSTYPAGAVVYNPADGKYYSYFNANLIAWTNTGAIDSAWTQVTTDLSNVPTDSTNYGSHYCTEVVYNGTDYLLPTTAYGTGYAVSNGWMNLTSFWNPVPAAYSQYFNVGTTY